MRRLSLYEALAEVLNPLNSTIVDVGCGDGSLVRHLADQGARAIGIEVSEEQLDRAFKGKAISDGSYRVGTGQALPLEDNSADTVIYSNSFHHLPLTAMTSALIEAARVLKPSGSLIVVEPMAEGPYFELVRTIDDETEVRAAAYNTLRHPPPTLERVDETVYMTTVSYWDADHFLTHVMAVDPIRRDRLPEVESTIRRLFASNRRIEGRKAVFDQPMRRMVYRRLA
jgi:ubiquinone/menaquinone biosynthesis C-methylase UbiE